MALFGKIKKKTAPAPKPQQPKFKLLWSKEFIQAPAFRGFRRIKLNRYRSNEVDKTIDTLKRTKYDLKDRPVRLDLIESVEPHNKYKEIRVYIDNMLIGSIFASDEKQFPMLTEYEYDKVHVRIEDSCPDEFIENVVTAKAYLFVHYPADAPAK